jgi:hypothetical protein
MPREAYINKFPEGLDKDSDDKIRKNTTYKDAHNVQLTGDGSFGSLENIKGTTFVSNIVSSISYDEINFLGAFNAKTFVYDSDFSGATIKDCIYLFYATEITGTYSFNISLLIPDTQIVYSVYSKEVDSGIMSSTIDAFSSGDAGVDTIYYTVEGMPIGRIRCIIDISDPNIIERQTELIKRYPSNSLIVSDVIYNPKDEAAVSDIHTISFSTVSEITLSSYKVWNGDALFDNDTTATDDFDVYVYYSLILDGGESNTPSGHIYIYDNVAGGISLTVAQTVTPGGTYSNNGTRIISRSGAYNPDPIRAEVSIDTGSSTGTCFARAEVSITSILKTSGDGSYLRGTPTSKSVQILLTP